MSIRGEPDVDRIRGRRVRRARGRRGSVLVRGVASTVYDEETSRRRGSWQEVGDELSAGHHGDGHQHEGEGL